MLDSDHEQNFGKVVRELPKVYDDALKKLLKANTQDFVDLLQKGMYVEEALPTELDAEHVYADGLIRCHDQLGNVQLAHFEFQRENDDRMGERLLEYNVLASHYNDYLPVASCVIYLKKGLKPPRPPFIRRLTDGTPTTHFIYASIELGSVTAEELLAKGLPGLLPLLPLTNGGNTHESVDIMVNELIEAGKTDILWIGYYLASRVFTNDGDLQWLKGRFRMLNDFLWDSPIYQEFVGEIRAEAKAEERAEVLSSKQQELDEQLLDLVDTRFPVLLDLANKCVGKINDTSILIRLLGKVGAAQTEQDAKKVLKSYLNEH